jgi:GNAT superfamily N-acetyltransferase
MQVVTRSERPDLAARAREVLSERWPEFVFHDAAAERYQPGVVQHFGDLEVVLLDGDEIAAGGWAVPFAWDGTVADLPDGYAGALARAVTDHRDGRRPTALSVMAAAVASGYDRQGLATQVLRALIERADAARIGHVVAPLRPTGKHRYPLQSMTDYASWVRADGFSVDPWIRTHQRMGAVILGPAPRSMVIIGSVHDWEGWTGMEFRSSGRYVVPGALAPIEVDRDADTAIYVEENLWVQHR